MTLIASPPKGSDRQLAEDRHRYVGPSRKAWPSVTAITGLLDMGKSGAMAGSAAKLTREGQNYREVWNAKRDLGTRLHGYVECWARGEDVEAPASDLGYLDAAERFFLDHSPSWLQVERVVLWESSDGLLGYGGRFDAVVLINGDRWLIDVKTGKPYPFEHTCQLAAYRFSDGMAIYDEEGNLTPGLEPLPVIDRTACLYLKEDGTYDLTQYPADKEAHRCFLRMLEVHAMHAELAARCKGAK